MKLFGILISNKIRKAKYIIHNTWLYKLIWYILFYFSFSNIHISPIKAHIT